MNRQEANARLLNVIWRCVLVLVGSFSSAEIVSSSLEAGGYTAVNVATTGVAAALVFAFLADMMGLLAGCRAYLRGDAESLKPLTPGFWKAWASLTTIIIAIDAWTRPSNPDADPWFIVYSSRPPPDGRAPRLSTIPVFYAHSADHKNWETGVSFTPSELDVSAAALGRIFAAFKACGSVSDAPPVQLEIVGFASSKEFDHTQTTTESNLLNVEAANRRAWAAYCFAQDKADVTLTNASDWSDMVSPCASSTSQHAGARPPITVRVTRWTKGEQGFDEMMRSRPLQDRPKGIPEKQRRDPEELDRRVDVNVIHAGACQLDAIAIGRR